MALSPHASRAQRKRWLFPSSLILLHFLSRINRIQRRHHFPIEILNRATEICVSCSIDCCVNEEESIATALRLLAWRLSSSRLCWNGGSSDGGGRLWLRRRSSYLRLRHPTALGRRERLAHHGRRHARAAILAHRDCTRRSGGRAGGHRCTARHARTTTTGTAVDHEVERAAASSSPRRGIPPTASWRHIPSTASRCRRSTASRCVESGEVGATVRAGSIARGGRWRGHEAHLSLRGGRANLCEEVAGRDRPGSFDTRPTWRAA